MVTRSLAVLSNKHRVSCASRWLRCIRCFTGWRSRVGCAANGKLATQVDAGAVIGSRRAGRRRWRRCVRNGLNSFERCGSLRRWPLPDWNKMVHDHLGGLDLLAIERAEIVEELAGHLEEIFHDLRRQGLSEEDATRGCLLEVEDWREFSLRIEAARRKENLMNNRVTQLWLPGLLTFILSMGLLALTQIFGPKPWVVTFGHPPMAVVYIPWLLALPLVGGIGAFLSRRAGGSWQAVISSTTFPVLPFLER